MGVVIFSMDASIGYLASGPEFWVGGVVDPVDTVGGASTATPEGLLAVSLAVGFTPGVWQLAKSAVATPTTEAHVSILKGRKDLVYMMFSTA